MPDFNIPGMTEDELRAQFTRDFNAGRSHLKDWKTEARQIYDMEAGKQWSADDEAQMKEEERPAVTFNFFAKFIDVLQGLQINNRQDIRYFPRETGDIAVNEIMTGAAEWARYLCDAEDEESDAFHDAARTGLGWMEWYLDAEREDAPTPAGRRIGPMEMTYDPKARQKGLLDRNWTCRVKQMSVSEY